MRHDSNVNQSRVVPFPAYSLFRGTEIRLWRKHGSCLESLRCTTNFYIDYKLDCNDELYPIYFYKANFYVPIDDLPFTRHQDFHFAMKEAIEDLVDEDNPNISFKVKALLEDETTLQTTGLNNCFFKTDSTLEHDELRFRSKGEIAIYDELKCRKVLFFPNPAAVLGNEKARRGDMAEKREPDFLICYKGKWGILEINGDRFHSGQAKTSADHERARKFNHYGLFFVQSYEDFKCKNDPGRVVDEFLRLLENHK